MNPPQLSLDLGNWSQSMIARAMPLSIPCLSRSWTLLGCQMDSSSIEVHTCALGHLTKIHLQPVRQRKQISTRDGLRLQSSNSFVIACMICFVRKIGLVCLRWPDPASSYFKQPYHTVSFLISPNFILAPTCTNGYLLKHHQGHNEAFPNASKLKISNWGAPSFLHHSEKKRVSMKRPLPCQMTNAHWRYNTGLPVSKDSSAGNSCNKGWLLLPWLICSNTLLPIFSDPTEGTGKICLTGFGESRDILHVEEHWEPPCIYTCRKTVLICLVLRVSR